MPRVDKALWDAVSPLLDRALDLDDDGQAALIEEVRPDQPALADALAGLLEDHRKLHDHDFLSDSPSPRRAPRSLAGHTIGAYTLDVPLGDGGMGTVWRAHRSDGRFEGDVAVKLLHLGLTDHRGIERFTREGTLLARLAHPNIARLLDAGVTDSITDRGRPYLVLEYVEGTPIDEYADARQLEPRDRLALFLQVADAVAYAHARLVVHRDLKPSNILVDASGRIKLLDFGIAKLIEDDAHGAHGAHAAHAAHGDRSELTGAGINACTPAYAAPEQARGEAVTTETDVYVLGVLLYVLLTGRHPTAPDSHASAEHLRRLIDEEPTRASVAVTITTDETEDAVRRAKLRKSSPERLRRLYRGDLDSILAVALQKQPSARYATVTAFADDVRRYLQHEAISVQTATWAYRARKFLRRNTAGAIVTAVIAAILVTATIVSTRLMLEARRQRDEARYQERRAAAQSDFMRNMVTQIGSQPMTMKEVLDRGRVALEQQYAGDPAFVARMLSVLSGPYVELGDRATAHEMMQRVLEIAKTLGDPSLLASAHCENADDFSEMREYARAGAHLEEARPLLARLNPAPTGLLVGCSVAESNLAMGLERFDEAVLHMERAIAWLERDGNTNTPRYTAALNALARAYLAAGRLRESLHTQRRVTEISRRIGRGRTISQVTSLSNTGYSEEILGRWLSAMRSHQEAFEIARGLQPSARSPGYLMINYARVLVDLGRTSEGVEWLNGALQEPKLAPRFVNRARMLLTGVLLDRGDVAAARTEFQQLERDLTAPGPDERLNLTILRARFAAAEGRIHEAQGQVRDGLTADGYPGRVSQSVHKLLVYGAELAIDAGDRDRAIRLAQEAVAACERHFGSDEPSANTGRAHLMLGHALHARGRTAEARTAFDRAAALIAAAAGGDHPWVREARQALGQ
jgi:serine/threonine protein kinase/tetratricopeptide (TPR) repeat protein